jgi:hypothetical protein
MDFGMKVFGGLILAGGVCFADAQAGGSVDISGTVKDSKTGTPLAGAAVTLVSDTTLMAATDEAGAFHLSRSATGLRFRADKARPGITLSGNALTLEVPYDNAALVVDVFDLKSAHLGKLLDRRVRAGRYRLDLAASGIPGGLHFVRARVGGETAAFRIFIAGLRGREGEGVGPALAAGANLAKVAEEPVEDTLKVTKAGYRMQKKAIGLHTGTYPIAMVAAPPAGDLKIVSERSLPQVDWGSNVDVQVWDGGTQLEGEYKTDPFEGIASWKITFGSGQAYSAWGFVSKAAPENMSAWKGGTMHLAVKGNVTTLGVTMASADQFPGNSVMVDLSEYGYKPDSAWHEIRVPMDRFEGTDLGQVNVYCGLAYPLLTDTARYNPTLDYQVDDIYWSLKK